MIVFIFVISEQVQWYFKGEPITAQDFTITMEDDQHGLYIPALKPENAGRYTCTAENDKGKATCTANLVVSGKLSTMLI